MSKKGGVRGRPGADARASAPPTSAPPVPVAGALRAKLAAKAAERAAAGEATSRAEEAIAAAGRSLDKVTYDECPAGIERQPLSRIEWVPPTSLRANAYNPNRVFEPELKLLAISILEDGWVAPIYATMPDGDGVADVVDGFHRWRVGGGIPGDFAQPEFKKLLPLLERMRALTGGLVPVVRSRHLDANHRRLATIRMNRARGQHGVLAMGSIMRELLDQGMTPEEVQARLQMDGEEFQRLRSTRGSPGTHGKDSFGRGWIPTPLPGDARAGRAFRPDEASPGYVAPVDEGARDQDEPSIDGT